MTDDSLARQIYWRLLEQDVGLEFNCSFDELPHDFRLRLQAVGAALPAPDPWDKFDKFTAWAHAYGHYTVAPRVASFCSIEKRENEAENTG